MLNAASWTLHFHNYSEDGENLTHTKWKWKSCKSQGQEPQEGEEVSMPYCVWLFPNPVGVLKIWQAKTSAENATVHGVSSAWKSTGSYSSKTNGLMIINYEVDFGLGTWCFSEEPIITIERCKEINNNGWVFMTSYHKHGEFS